MKLLKKISLTRAEANELIRERASPSVKGPGMYDEQPQGNKGAAGGDGRLCTCIMAGKESHMEINLYDLPNYVCQGCGASEAEVNITRQLVARHWAEGGRYPVPPGDLGLYLPESAQRYWADKGWRFG